MKKKPSPALPLLLLLSTCAFGARAADLTLADPFGDEMVLQRDMKIPVWGVDDADAKVTVAFAGQTQTATADAQGNWKVELAPLKASADNRTLSVADGKRKLEVKNVLVGEVWICSGQSNMEMGVLKVADAKKEVAAANFPAIRLRVMNHAMASLPKDAIDGSPWRVCTPASILQGSGGSFAATAYYFGRDLHRELHVPVGLVQAAWGGTLIEPWTTREGFHSQPALKAQADWLDQAIAAGSQKWVPQNTQPTVLYNAMVAPWIRFPVRGAIWYQGESNHIQHDGALYADRMTALVGGWRKAWDRTDADFPFYFVQIAPYNYAGFKCAPASMGAFWEAQQKAAQTIPNTGLAHTQDISDGDLHPKNKQDVGRRLARLALSRTYGKKMQGGASITDDCGPEFKALTVKADRLIVSFDHANSGLASRDGKPLSHFEIAGKDHLFAPAQAQIEGAAVVLKSAKVPAPVEVRFGWNDTAQPNLMNRDKLPAATFHAAAPAN